MPREKTSVKEHSEFWQKHKILTQWLKKHCVAAYCNTEPSATSNQWSQGRIVTETQNLDTVTQKHGGSCLTLLSFCQNPDIQSLNTQAIHCNCDVIQCLACSVLLLLLVYTSHVRRTQMSGNPILCWDWLNVLSVRTQTFNHWTHKPYIPTVM